MVEAEVGLDSELAQTQVAGVELLEAAELEGTVVEAAARALLVVVDVGGAREQRDPVVCGVVRHPRSEAILVGDLGADDRAVPVDHLLQARRLQVDVVERGADHLGFHLRGLLSIEVGSLAGSVPA